ncbi:hypothetical protein Ancab_034214 [Ancistrocladus abbreviatus]
MSSVLCPLAPSQALSAANPTSPPASAAHSQPPELPFPLFVTVGHPYSATYIQPTPPVSRSPLLNTTYLLQLLTVPLDIRTPKTRTLFRPTRSYNYMLADAALCFHNSIHQQRRRPVIHPYWQG